MTDPIFVLVVEDEALVRISAVDKLRDPGFTVLEVSNAIEAVDILATEPRIQVVFTDVDMPGGMNGLQLAGAVKDRWPPIKIIVTSGTGSLTRPICWRSMSSCRSPTGVTPWLNRSANC